jgi:hypothetical protein
MGWLDRFFGRKHANAVTSAADVMHRQAVAGRDPGQSAEEQAATRQRMEAELETQRNRRMTPPSSGT